MLLSVFGLSFVCLIAYSTQSVKNCKTPGISADAQEICLDCNPGYYLNSSYSLKECKKCLFNCGTCIFMKDTNTYSCANCTEGYRFDVPNYNCTACPSGCKFCNEENVCMVCKDGYSLQGDQTCKGTSHFWKYFFIVAVVAGACYVGYYVYTNYFVKKEADDIPVVETNAYKSADKKAGDGTTPVRAGKRADPNAN